MTMPALAPSGSMARGGGGGSVGLARGRDAGVRPVPRPPPPPPPPRGGGGGGGGAAFVATARLQSVLIPGRRFLGALEKLNRMTWHDGRNGVLVDQLRMPIATQQHAEIIEPSHHALQLDAVHQKDGERNFGFADVVEEGVL